MNDRILNQSRTQIAELMKENRLFTRAAFYGRKTLTVNVTKEQLAAQVQAKQKLEDERQRKQCDLIQYVTNVLVLIHRRILLDIARN